MTRARSPQASWRRTIEVAGAVVGDLDGVDLDADAGDRPTRRRPAAASRRRRPPADDAHGQVEALGLGDDVGEAGAVREQAHGHGVAALVGVGVGVAGAADEADADGTVEHVVAVAAVVEDGDAERRLGDVDVAVRAHLELGGVPRARRVRRAAHGAELDAARRDVGADVERERQRQQVLLVVPVDVDLDVEARRAGAQHVRQRRRRRPERSLHLHHPDERAALDDLDPSAPMSRSGSARTHASRSHAS